MRPCGNGADVLETLFYADEYVVGVTTLFPVKHNIQYHLKSSAYSCEYRIVQLMPRYCCICNADLHIKIYPPT